MEENALIFLSYASPDYERVHAFYGALLNAGLDPWLDKEKLVAGQNWDFEIKRALAKATIIVVFLSENSVSRRGYVQREIKIALGQAQAKLHDDIYVIPVMLDEVPIPSQLEDIQVIGSSAEDPYQQLLSAIDAQLERLGLQNAKLQGDPKLRWSMTRYNDRWEGLPGHDTSYQIPRFSSEQAPQAQEMSDVIRGWVVAEAMAQREVKFSQSTEFCNFGQEPFFRMNSWDASCATPIVKDRIVSLSYSVWMMNAGAAHPNMYFKTFAFTLHPTTQIKSLESIFEDTKSSLEVIRDDVRYQLLHDNDMLPDQDPANPELSEDYVKSGTDSWKDFDCFTFEEDGINLYFSPYQVAAYVFGPQFAKVKYDKLAKFMHRHYAFALGVEHLTRAPLLSPEEVKEIMAGLPTNQIDESSEADVSKEQTTSDSSASRASSPD